MILNQANVRVLVKLRKHSGCCLRDKDRRVACAKMGPWSMKMGGAVSLTLAQLEEGKRLASELLTNKACRLVLGFVLLRIIGKQKGEW